MTEISVGSTARSRRNSRLSTFPFELLEPVRDGLGWRSACVHNLYGDVSVTYWLYPSLPLLGGAGSEWQHTRRTPKLPLREKLCQFFLPRNEGKRQPGQRLGGPDDRCIKTRYCCAVHRHATDDHFLSETCQHILLGRAIRLKGKKCHERFGLLSTGQQCCKMRLPPYLRMGPPRLDCEPPWECRQPEKRRGTGQFWSERQSLLDVIKDRLLDQWRQRT